MPKPHINTHINEAVRVVSLFCNKDLFHTLRGRCQSLCQGPSAGPLLRIQDFMVCYVNAKGLRKQPSFSANIGKKRAIPLLEYLFTEGVVKSVFQPLISIYNTVGIDIQSRELWMRNNFIRDIWVLEKHMQLHAEDRSRVKCLQRGKLSNQERHAARRFLCRGRLLTLTWSPLPVPYLDVGVFNSL